MKTFTSQSATLNKNARQGSAISKNSKNTDGLNCLVPLPSTWVKLLDCNQSSSYDEALLMCQYPDGNWSAWIPDVGEVKLHSGQFCRIS